MPAFFIMKMLQQLIEPDFAGTIPGVTVDEDNVDNSTINITTFFTDYNNDTLTYDYQGGENLTINFLSNGFVEITPDANFNGTSLINFTASDGTNITTADNEVLVTVNPINDAPDITAINDQAAHVAEEFLYNVTATDIETHEIHNCLSSLPNFNGILKIYLKNNTIYIGRFGVYGIVHVQCTMGAIDVQSSILSIKNILESTPGRYTKLLTISLNTR